MLGKIIIILKLEHISLTNSNKNIVNENKESKKGIKKDINDKGNTIIPFEKIVMLEKL